MNKFILASMSFAAIVISAALFSYFVPVALAQTSQITLGWAPCACFEPVMVAEDKGLFHKNGLNVKYERFPSFFPITEAILAGKIDGGIINSVFALNAALGTSQYIKLVYPLNIVGDFGGQHYGPQAFMVVRSDSPIESLKDLRNKKVGVGTFNDVGHVALLEELARAGLKPEDVVFVQVPHPQMEGAIVNREVDAGLIIYPFITFAQDRGTVKVIAQNIDDVLNRTVIAWIGANPEFVRNNRETTQNLIKSLAEAVQWINDPNNAEQRYNIISKWTDIPLDTVRKMGLQTQYFGIYPSGFKDYEQYLKPWNELMIKYGLVDKVAEFMQFDPKALLEK